MTVVPLPAACPGDCREFADRSPGPARCRAPPWCCKTAHRRAPRPPRTCPRPYRQSGSQALQEAKGAPVRRGHGGRASGAEGRSEPLPLEGAQGPDSPRGAPGARLSPSASTCDSRPLRQAVWRRSTAPCPPGGRTVRHPACVGFQASTSSCRARDDAQCSWRARRKERLMQRSVRSVMAIFLWLLVLVRTTVALKHGTSPWYGGIRGAL
jgi:hypothetical protein